MEIAREIQMALWTIYLHLPRRPSGERGLRLRGLLLGLRGLRGLLSPPPPLLILEPLPAGGGGTTCACIAAAPASAAALALSLSPAIFAKPFRNAFEPSSPCSLSLISRKRRKLANALSSAWLSPSCGVSSFSVALIGAGGKP